MLWVGHELDLRAKAQYGIGAKKSQGSSDENVKDASAINICGEGKTW